MSKAGAPARGCVTGDGARHRAWTLLRGVAAGCSTLVNCLALAITLAFGTADRGMAAGTNFQAFLEALWPEAKARGISRTTFDRAFQGVEPDLGLPDLVLPGKPDTSSRGQAEFTRPPQDYLARTLLANLATQGRRLQTRHSATLAEVERKVGVDGVAVLAIWGRETAYGGHKLSHYAIRVLATQAFTGRRHELFRTELLHALKLIEDGIVTPADMRSSWAGAMGLTQFMPSEFYASGYDLDGDGKVDLFNSVPDALGSAAKQLKQKGWILGLPWGFEVKPGAQVDCANDGPANERPIAEWVRRGVVRSDGRPFADAHLDRMAYLMSPAGAFGPQFLVTENFKVLRAYNTSDLYALFVGHLADRIAGGGDFRSPWAQITQLRTDGIRTIQQALKGQGFAIDKIDGKIGSNTRWQIGLFQRKAGLAVDCWPTEALLKSVWKAP